MNCLVSSDVKELFLNGDDILRAGESVKSSSIPHCSIECIRFLQTQHFRNDIFVPIGAVHKSLAAQQVTSDVIVAGVVLSTFISALLSLLLTSSREIYFPILLDPKVKRSHQE